MFAILIGPAGIAEHEAPALAELEPTALLAALDFFELLHADNTVANAATAATTISPRRRAGDPICVIYRFLTRDVQEQSS
jgi:hypothetical protein